MRSIGEQERIATALGSFDGLIELNLEQITALRSLAGHLFTGATSGQPTTAFGEIATLVRDSVRADAIERGTPYVALEHFSTEGGGLQAVGVSDLVDSNKNRFQSGDVLYGKLRPYFRKHDRPGFDGVCSTEIWVLRPKNTYGAAFLDAIVSQPDFTDFAMSGSGGTRMPRADWKHVSTKPVAVPSAPVRDELESALEELWQISVQLREEIAELTRTRDELLPLLISGKVRVDEGFEVARWLA